MFLSLRPLLEGTTFYVVSAILGLIVGSFANVCIHRLPKNESVVKPASRCPKCLTPIRMWDNIPVISYLLLRGRCRACGVSISARYPAVEALNAILYLLAALRFGGSTATFFYFLFITALIVITFIDYDLQIIPDEITLPGIPIGLLAGWLILPDPFYRAVNMGITASLIGAATGFLLYYSIAFISRGGMGGGDIKMMAMIGAVLGWKGVILTTFLASCAGSIAGLYLMVFKGKGRKAKVPFGPFLAAGALMSLFLGQEIVSWYIWHGQR
ncbi:MAG: prepilin peptidase [Nitrospiraceae bacterium]|nr:prepilin peptidase [Nitrospiraceae bacterium]